MKEVPGEDFGKLTQKRKFVFVTLLRISFGLMFQHLNRAIYSRKCSINASAKFRNSGYVYGDLPTEKVNA